MLHRYKAHLSAGPEGGSPVASHGAHRSSGGTPLVVRAYTATLSHRGTCVNELAPLPRARLAALFEKRKEEHDGSSASQRLEGRPRTGL
jgi:hypothetical protein